MLSGACAVSPARWEAGTPRLPLSQAGSSVPAQEARRMRALARELRAPQAALPEAARQAERRPVKCWELKQRNAARKSQRRSICWE